MPELSNQDEIPDPTLSVLMDFASKLASDTAALIDILEAMRESCIKASPILPSPQPPVFKVKYVVNNSTTNYFVASHTQESRVSTYSNHGNVGAMGEGATAHDFKQIIGQSEDEEIEKATPQDLAHELRELFERMEEEDPVDAKTSILARAAVLDALEAAVSGDGDEATRRLGRLSRLEGARAWISSLSSGLGAGIALTIIKAAAGWQ